MPDGTVSVKNAHSGNRSDQSRFWVVPELQGLECMHTRYRTHCFAPHTHETFVIGQIVSGYQNYRNKGVERTWGAGSTLVINPDDLHDCRPGDLGSEYRTFYPTAEMLTDIAGQISEKTPELPWFRQPQIDQDVELSARLTRLQQMLDHKSDKLALESEWMESLSMLLLRHSDFEGQAGKIGDEAVLVQRICDYLNDNLAEDVDLQELAQLADMNKFRLIRSFKKVLGISPHAYRLNRRLSRAKDYLSKGMGLADAAITSGFYDQAHFSKSFKRAIGITPRSYQLAYCAV